VVREFRGPEIAGVGIDAWTGVAGSWGVAD